MRKDLFTHTTLHTTLHAHLITTLSTTQAGLKASDEASIVYSYVGNLKKAVELSNVISDYKDYITTATKGDISPGDAPGADVIAEDEQKVIKCHQLTTKYQHIIC